MTTKRISWILAFLLLCLLIDIGYGYIGHKVNTPQNLISTPGGITFSYDNQEYGLATTPEQILAKAYIPPCDTTSMDYCVYRIGDAYKGTNFESAGLRIKERKDLTTKTSCISSAPEGYVDFHPIVSEKEGYTTSVFGPIGDAGAGHYASGNLYRLFYGTTCYEFETRIGETQFANYPVGTITLFSDADRVSVMTELETVVKNITLVSTGTKVIFPELAPTSVAIGGTMTVQGTTISVLELLEDSRCPVDVQCIQAGTVRVRASVDAMNRDFTFKLAEPQKVGNAIITLSAVSPTKKSTVTVKASDYRFFFTVVK